MRRCLARTGFIFLLLPLVSHPRRHYGDGDKLKIIDEALSAVLVTAISLKCGEALSVILVTATSLRRGFANTLNSEDEAKINAIANIGISTKTTPLIDIDFIVTWPYY